jgi:putative hydrolase of the HAD superfamily
VRGDPFAYLFDKTYFTFKLGLRKPDERIYRKVLADAGLKGNETLFIDDSIRNVLGAQRVGILSLVIRGNGYLRWLPELLGIQ